MFLASGSPVVKRYAAEEGIGDDAALTLWQGDQWVYVYFLDPFPRPDGNAGEFYDCIDYRIEIYGIFASSAFKN